MAKMNPAVLLGALGAGALLLMSGKKKKGSQEEEDIFEEVEPEPEPKKGPLGGGRPKGDPPGGDSYDSAYWGSGNSARQKILLHFKALGYSVPIDRDTMNELGADGKLGGGDDIPNPEVKRFQHDYNNVSRIGGDMVLGHPVPTGMGGLSEDGFVGPYVLNGLKYLNENSFLGMAQWAEAKKQAAQKGFK